MKKLTVLVRLRQILSLRWWAELLFLSNLLRRHQAVRCLPSLSEFHLWLQKQPSKRPLITKLSNDFLKSFCVVLTFIKLKTFRFTSMKHVWNIYDNKIINSKYFFLYTKRYFAFEKQNSASNFKSSTAVSCFTMWTSKLVHVEEYHL